MWLIHTKILIFGSKRFDDNGEEVIPCQSCGKRFKSRTHFGDGSFMVFDTLCKNCR